MKKYFYITGSSLLICLFIYVFYRTEKTLINQLILLLTSKESFNAAREFISSSIPLPEFIIYSLPEALWILCITISSASFYIQFGKRLISLVYFPIILAIGLELIQLFRISNGRFDIMDIALSFASWCLGILLIKKNRIQQELFDIKDFASVRCAFCYIIVFCAHVSY